MRTPRSAHMCMCARVCICVRMCVINESKHPFQDFCYLINNSTLIYPLSPFNFCHVGLYFNIFCAQVA